MTSSDRLDATFAALADPTRRAILARLASGEASVLELAEPFEMTQPSISKHLKSWSAPVSSRAAATRSAAPAAWKPSRSPRPLNGSRSTAASEPATSSAWTLFSTS
jgi:DNA-binding transcriptional ArsR family regulator